MGFKATTTKDEALLEEVKNLSEIELLAFMEGLSKHLQKNKQEHLIDQVFEVGDNVHDDYREEINKLEDKIEKLESDLEVSKSDLVTACKKLQDIKNILE